MFRALAWRAGFGLLAILAVVSVPAPSRAAPLSESDIFKLVELGIDDSIIIDKLKKNGAAAIEEAALAKLKAAGASAEVLKAIQEAGKSKTPATKAITYQDIQKLLALEVSEEQILALLQKSPTVFALSEEQIAELKKAGATQKLLEAMKGARSLSPQAMELITDFAIVLDCSGSMKEATKEGEAKMAAAKRVVADLVKNIPEGLNVTLVLYGHEVFAPATDPRNCQAVKVARALSPLNAGGKAELSELIASLKPTGATPIAKALKLAGQELAKRDAFSGLVLVTDGIESCGGDPAAEAAALAANPKLSFGISVVGFGVKPEESAVLEKIAKSGRGKYYDADTAADLAASLSAVADELEKKAKPAPVEKKNRRAVVVHKPTLKEFPEFVEIRLQSYGLGSVSVDGKGQFGEEIRVPSGTEKYDVLLVPKHKESLPVPVLKEYVFEKREVVEVRPEEQLGFVKVNGTKKLKEGLLVFTRGLGSIHRVQQCKQYGEIMVVPAGKYSVRADNEMIEEGLIVKPGELQELD